MVWRICSWLSPLWKGGGGLRLQTIESGKMVWSDGVSASVDYVRLLLPVKDEAGRYFIINYSKQIGTRQKPTKDPGE